MSDERLAHTGTMPTADAPAAPVTQLGRFRIERTLGVGGMGVVYAAFDPELERRIALKVRKHTGGPEAPARFLREARAMAKLSHPNVIAVFETGTAGGQDFVAMELIDGETLAEWLARTKPRWRPATTALLAAGDGLAAAHDAGLVHRDFKPHNVLRSRAGKIVVTDFGLVMADGPAARTDAPATSTPPADMTATGALLGTPAYMAPEQWTGDGVGPASDQFAFCIALWEAVAGARPFQGGSVMELEAACRAGIEKVDDSAVPRGLRTVLRRGLAATPDARYPDMRTLLAAVRGVLHRRRRIALAVAGVGAAAALAGGFAIARGSVPAGPTCPAPVLDPAAVWSPAQSDALAARGASETAAILDDQAARWISERAAACAAPTEVRSARIACLDAVQGRFAAVTRALAAGAGPLDPDGVSSSLVDPASCGRGTPPSFAVTDAELTAAFTELRGAIAGAPSPPTPASPAGACARIVQHVAALARVDDAAGIDHDAITALLADRARIEELVPRCTDDHVRALAALAITDEDDASAVEHAAEAVARISPSGADGEIELLRARHRGSPAARDAALAHLDRALAVFQRTHRPRGVLAATIERAKLLVERDRPGDLEAALALIDRERARATRVDPRIAGHLELVGVSARWALGDVEAAERTCEELRAKGIARHPPMAAVTGTPAAPVSGIVVDEAGTPVAGATVAAGIALFADSARIDSCARGIGATTVTDAHGHFTIAAGGHAVAAMLGTRRAPPIDAGPDVRLVLAASSRLAGRVEPAPAGHATVLVYMRAPSRYRGIAPVMPDGTWGLDGVPRGTVTLAVQQRGERGFDDAPPPVVVDRATITGLVVTPGRARTVHVIARGETEPPPEAAVIWMFAGSPGAPRSLHDHGHALSVVVADKADPFTVAPELRASLAADDLVADVRGEPADATVCALAMSKKLIASAPVTTLVARFEAEVPGCAAIPAGATSVVVPVPAIRRAPSTDTTKTR